MNRSQRFEQSITRALFTLGCLGCWSAVSAQINPEPPPLNVTGQLTNASLEGFSFGDWHPIDHGRFVFFGQRCRVDVVATGNNHEEFDVDFGIFVAINVAAEEIGEMDNPFGDGTRKDYAKFKKLKKSEQEENWTITVRAIALQQNVQVELQTDEFIVPRFVWPEQHGMANRSTKPIRTHARLLSQRVEARAMSKTAVPNVNTLISSARLRNEWEVEVLNVVIGFGAVDVPTESRVKVLGTQWDQILVGEIVE